MSLPKTKGKRTMLKKSKMQKAPTLKGKKEKGKKKIDRLMEMLEKSHMIGDRTVNESAIKED